MSRRPSSPPPLAPGSASDMSRPRPSMSARGPSNISTNSSSFPSPQPGYDPPSRPERSMRRPLGSPSPALRTQEAFFDARSNPSNYDDGRRSSVELSDAGSPMIGSDTSRSRQVPVDNGQTKSRRMMESLNMKVPTSVVAPSSTSRSTAPSGDSTSRIRSTRRDSFESLNSEIVSPVLPQINEFPASNAFANLSAPRRELLSQSRTSEYDNDQSRRPSQSRQNSDTPSNQARKQKAAPIAAVLDPREYPDTPAFREIEVVLRRIRTDWPIIVQDSSEEVIAGSGGEFKKFDPVTLALSLLNPATVGTSVSLPSFLRLKAELDHAISTTLSSSSTSYRAYESSITTYNSTLITLGNNVKDVHELRKGLVDARERLEGKGREGLAGMYNRMGHLEEMVKILDEIDHLRTIPDRIETLLSEKRFLSAVILLVRSSKTINKPEMMEIGALSDLRAWMLAEEGVLLEILIEELHNHLYLKSFYTEVRWKPYTRGQTCLPVVDFGDDLLLPLLPESSSGYDLSRRATESSESALPRAPKLERFLNSLSLRPSHNPILDEPVDDFITHVEDAENAALEAGLPLPSVPVEISSSSGTTTRKNLELDSFVYLEGLLESLGVLGKLGVGLDAIGQRVQNEIYNLVDATLEEVEERSDSLNQGGVASSRQQSSFVITSGLSTTNPVSTPLPSASRHSLSSLSTLSLSRGAAHRSSLLRLSVTESIELEMNVETLKDLFWTLFSKLDAVMQGFRVAYEVSSRIVDRRDFKDSLMLKSLMFSLSEVWKPIQQEVRDLLHDYLTDDESGTVSSRNPNVSVNEVLRLNKSGRDHAKSIFRFADSDIKASSKALKSYEDELNRALKVAVPGLMTDASLQPGQATIVSSFLTDDRYNSGSGGGAASKSSRPTHKSLVAADAFNVSVLIGPTLSFLSRVKDTMPEGLLQGSDEEASTSNFGGFLDDFVLRTFLPQLEEKVTSVFHQAVGGLDAFQDDPNYRKVSNVPIVKSVSNLMLLISSLCSMLRSTPFHRENYSHLIVSVIHQFYQRCVDRYKDLASQDPSSGSDQDEATLLKTSAVWAELPVINTCMVEIREIDPQDTIRMRAALKRETKIELEEKGHGPIKNESLIHPSKRILALGTLYSSLDWFIIQVSSLKTAFDSTSPPALPTPTHEPPTNGTRDSENLDAEDDDVVPADFSLPLTYEMTQAFDTLLQRYQQLADLVLFTLRLEIRLRTMHYLDKASRDGVYQLSEDIAEPDPSVVDLNTNLAEFDECAAATLAPVERRYIFEGLSLFMDHLLISNSRHIRLANQNGLRKMRRNILALQQNLKNIGDSPLEVDFDRSRKFWEVFGEGPAAMIESIRAGRIKYDFEDYKSLLNLMCGIDQSSKDDPTSAEGPVSATGDKSRRLYNEYLIELFALDDEPNDG